MFCRTKRLADEGRAWFEALARALEQFIRRHYAHWCDETIPALGGLTPRQAIVTPAGLERVKGLLRAYEDGEERQSPTQGRPACPTSSCGTRWGSRFEERFEPTASVRCRLGPAACLEVMRAEGADDSSQAPQSTTISC